MPNPDDQSACSFCRQPLRTTGNDSSIRPGEMPTKKTTAELEPILPQWLRDARAQSRQPAGDEPEFQPPQAAPPKPARPNPIPPTGWPD
jgi:hypothetical protein